MRDPLMWSFPIGRLFGISVRVHILFPIICLCLILRVLLQDEPALPAGTWIDMAMVLGLLFFTVVLHELGHCIAADRVGGDADEIFLWPLGGLTPCDVPHNPRAHFLTAAGGPLVNLLVCLGCALALAFLLDASYRPTWNPLWKPLRNGEGQLFLVRWDGVEVPIPVDHLVHVALARLFWVSWIMFLLNIVLIGFPWDGGRLLQSALWPYVGYRQATLYAIYAGFICMFVLVAVTFVFREIMILVLVFFTYTACKQEWITLESGGEESLFGYDFSQGYTSLERDEPVPRKPRRKKVNFFQRWLQRRAADKLRRQQEKAEAEARRVDELLEKIQRRGKDSLTEEENRFLRRYADRMKNK